MLGVSPPYKQRPIMYLKGPHSTLSLAYLGPVPRGCLTLSIERKEEADTEESRMEGDVQLKSFKKRRNYHFSFHHHWAISNTLTNFDTKYFPGFRRS